MSTDIIPNCHEFSILYLIFLQKLPGYISDTTNLNQQARRAEKKYVIPRPFRSDGADLSSTELSEIEKTWIAHQIMSKFLTTKALGNRYVFKSNTLQNNSCRGSDPFQTIQPQQDPSRT